MDEAALRTRLMQELPPGLVAHTERVVTLAEELARRWSLDVGLARTMALAHDVARHLGDAEWLRRAEAYGVVIDEVERRSPVLLHGPVGAEELRRHYGVDDTRVLHAVWWHTSGHAGYVPEAWAMFVADKVDPHKVAEWPALAEVLVLAHEAGLEVAALRYLDLRIEQGLRARMLIHVAAVESRNGLLIKLERPTD